MVARAHEKIALEVQDDDLGETFSPRLECSGKHTKSRALTR